MAGRSLWRVFTLQRHARCTKLSGYRANVTSVRKIALTTGIYASNSEDLKKLTPQDWQKKLTPQQYHVTREAGTEPPFSGSYYDHHEEGMYQCVCCEADLFSSATKFDSGSGWPSFHSGEDDNIKSHQDTSHFMLRTEVLCRQCKSHLGHVFPDGPPPTGLRYCINSLALNFVPKTDS